MIATMRTLSAALIACIVLAACQPRAPSPEYLAAVTEIRNRIDEFRGALSSVKDIPGKLQTLIDQQPNQPHAYAEAAHFLLFVDGNAWPARGKTGADAAASMLDDAQKADANFCETYWLRTQLNVALKRPDLALAASDAGRAHRCGDAWLAETRGRAVMIKAEFEGDPAAAADIDAADAAFRSVLDQGAGATSRAKAVYASAAFDEGTLLYRTGRHDELRQLLAKWEAAGLVFDVWGQLNMAYLDDVIGRFDHAQVAAQSALTVLQLPAARNAMGLALYGQAWSMEASGDGDRRKIDAIAAAARSYMPDDTIALDTLSGAACCVSDAWKRVLDKHRQAHAK